MREKSMAKRQPQTLKLSFDRDVSYSAHRAAHATETLSKLSDNLSRAALPPDIPLKRFARLYNDLTKNPLFTSVDWGAVDFLLEKELMRMTSAVFCGSTVPRLAHRMTNFVASDDTKEFARRQLVEAVATGRVEKPKCCVRCERQVAPHTLHGHHTDYSRPLDVQWLCQKCHREAHTVRQSTSRETRQL
jgi:hypothetical protein